MTKQIFKLSALIVFLIGVFLYVKMNTRGIEDMLDNGDIEAIERQIKNGAPVNAKSKWGVTPLHVAALNNKLGSTPLHSAIYYKDSSYCELLLKYGADPSIKDKHGATPISELETFNKPQMLQLLKQKIIKK